MTITVEVDLCKESFSDLEEFEKELFHSLMEAGVKMYRNVVEGLDTELHKERPRAEYRDKGVRQTCIKTLFGTVEYRRHVYERRDKDGSKEYVYLLDDMLGKQTIGTVSMTVCQMAANAVTESTYREASRQIKEHTGLDLSAQGVWNITQKLGVRRREEIEQESKQAQAAKGDGEIVSKILYEEADGVWLKLQGKDREERGPSSEMKVAIAYDGALWTAEKKRRILDNKVAYASFEKSEEFKQHKEGVVASRYDVSAIELRVLNGDGAGWVKTVSKGRKILVLDAFHRNKAIVENVNDPDLRKTMLTLLYEGKIEDLLQCIEASVESTLEPQEQEKRRTLLTYFLNNKESLLDYYRRCIKIPDTRAPEVHHARLGSMESNIFTLIGNRMKGRRACWSIRGAENLALLLCLKHTTGYGNLFSRVETGQESKVQEEYRAPLSASKLRETVGEGYESPFCKRAHLDTWIQNILAPRPVSELSFL